MSSEMRVTDAMARAAMDAYYAAFRFGKQDGVYYSEEGRTEAMRSAIAAALLARTEAGADGVDTFAEWLATEMPAGTVIGNPAWWANRIARQYRVRSGVTHPQDASGDAVMTGPSDHDDLPAFLEWVAGEVVRRDTRAGNFAEGLAQSLRGRAHILRIVKNDAMQANEAK